MKRVGLLTLAFGAMAFGCVVATGFAQEEEAPSGAAQFHQQVEPVLLARCLSCHGESGQAGLDLRTREQLLAGGDSGPAVAPSSASDSLLYDYVSSGQMPPDKPLSEDEVTAIKRWIEQGAYYPPQPLDPLARTTDKRAGYDWWSLQPIAKPQVPGSQAPAEWQQSPIDHFVYRRLAAAELTPSPPADPVTLLRRAKFDLLGLPPTPEEVAQFVAECQQETGQAGKVGDAAYESLIDRLLASPHYGEQWGRRWLDVIRFGESNGFERNVIHVNVWPFRDYVIRSFNNDKPFDQFIREHLAGDTMAADDPAAAMGATFLVCGPYDNVGNQDAAAAAQIRANTIDEMIRTTSEAFLGMTVGCSRCHDHKFDPISQRDYYQMYATFAGVTHNVDSLGSENRAVSETPEPWKGHYHPANGPFHVFGGGSPQQLGSLVQPASPSGIKAASTYQLASDSPEADRRQALADWLVADDNPLPVRVVVNRLWQGHFGRGIVATPSDFGFLGGEPTHPELLDWLASELRTNGWHLKPLHKQIMLSATYRQSSEYRPAMAQVDGDSTLLWRYPPRRLAAEEIRDAMLAVAGELDPQMGGPGFRLFRYVQDNVATYHPLDVHGPETYRRSVYQHRARATQIDLMTEFDAPDCAFAVPRRSSTTTPLQALTLLNHDFTLKMSEALAERLAAASEDPHEQVALAFELAFARPPAPDEAEAAVRLVETHGLPAFGRAMFNANPFLYLD
ncbi:PSD1 and planctomycete cytochrome C domain-containing protein [Aeoliella mucimassa]|uniref:Planctomycete cytochrome C n=1 Tax=Aeoliella mucimassa TaxID=2527972 RepID=A0A518AWC5_9BACT|nr:PSD1 and planctomycete cytochrome C domain-containing protein [Aeoliella mucimassa]QDU59022.1 Planctomycete cytochrome C [Aeoliella mucimassa]